MHAPHGSWIVVENDPGVPAGVFGDVTAGLDPQTSAQLREIERQLGQGAELTESLLLEAGKQIGTAQLSGNVLSRDSDTRMRHNRLGLSAATMQRSALRLAAKNTGRMVGPVQERIRRELTDLMGKWQQERISLPEMRKQSAAELRRAYEGMRAAGRGAAGLENLGSPEGIVKEEESWFRDAVREELGYWNLFLDEIAGGRVSQGRVAQRLESYVKATRFMYDAARTQALPDSVLLYWMGPKRDDPTICEGCAQMMEWSPFTKMTLPATPRDGSTPCLSNCRHRVVVRVASTFNEVIRRNGQLDKLRVQTKRRAKSSQPRARMVEKLNEIKEEAHGGRRIGVRVKGSAGNPFGGERLPSVPAPRTLRQRMRASLGEGVGDAPDEDARETVGIFIPLPKRIAQEFPQKGEDSSDPHITMLFVGECNPDEYATVVEACRRMVAEQSLWLTTLEVSDYGEFETPDGKTIAHMIPRSHGLDLARIHELLYRYVTAAGINCEHHRDGAFKPHITLEYRDGPGYKGPRPKGTWRCGGLEVWGAALFGGKGHLGRTFIPFQPGAPITVTEGKWLEEGQVRKLYVTLDVPLERAEFRQSKMVGASPDYLKMYRRGLGRSSAHDPRWNYIYQLTSPQHLVDLDDPYWRQKAIKVGLLVRDWEVYFRSGGDMMSQLRLDGDPHTAFPKGPAAFLKAFPVLRAKNPHSGHPSYMVSLAFAKRGGLELVDGNAHRNAADPVAGELVLPGFVRDALDRYTEDPGRRIPKDAVAWCQENLPSRARDVYRGQALTINEWGEYWDPAKVSNYLFRRVGVRSLLEVYRGAQLKIKRGKTSSWSTAATIAREFGAGMASGDVNLLIKASVQAKDVVIDFTLLPDSLRRTFRHWTQNEVILRVGTFKAVVNDITVGSKMVEHLPRLGLSWDAGRKRFQPARVVAVAESAQLKETDARLRELMRKASSGDLEGYADLVVAAARSGQAVVAQHLGYENYPYVIVQVDPGQGKVAWMELALASRPGQLPGTVFARGVLGPPLRLVPLSAVSSAAKVILKWSVAESVELAEVNVRATPYTSFDQALYSSMDLRDVARLLQRAAERRDVGTLLPLLERIIAALETVVIAVEGRPRGMQVARMFRDAFITLVDSLHVLPESVTRDAYKLDSLLTKLES